MKNDSTRGTKAEIEFFKRRRVIETNRTVCVNCAPNRGIEVLLKEVKIVGDC